MDKVRRILVYICKDQSTPQRAQFVQSVTSLFTEGADDEVKVKFSLEENRFILFKGDGGAGVSLKRPAFCPIKHLSVKETAALPLEIKNRGVDVGVAILLQSANQKVLLTRRAKQLRIFPNVWVPPGGHLEPDETLLAAGLRELKEETGLSLDPEVVCPKVLVLWESVYPPLLSSGLPLRHHIVVYLLICSPLSHLQLQSSLSPSPAEVSACLWADAGLARAMVSAVDGEDGGLEKDEEGVAAEKLPTSVSVSVVSTGGALSQATLPLSVLLRRAPISGPDVERVSTGTKVALEQWLRSLKSET
ncbi:nucleoside diphosphate-linked moiety X motif 17 [Cynoglossus semilaevis]|uniref:m7GpppN-mRNA hydrolase NUDT17 n=1 Tax=Cynoglossus semilaevis TaxID=244447 RepID=A0A3P8UJ24_CYNSE|nr:nucleoside diphosphate-linked moiety X motif 17 [Cynoglossus semilaevis]